jgi:hypothetical protein
MTYLQYTNYIGSGTEFLAIAAALIFKTYRTKFGLIIFLMPLSSCIADSLYLYSNIPKYIPFGMFYGIFDLFNTLAFFKIIDVFSKNEFKVIFLIKIITAIIIITSIVEILQTKTRYHDIASGLSNLFDGFVGLIAAFRLIQRTAKEKKDFSHFFYANLSVTILSLIMFSPQIGQHLLQQHYVEYDFCKMIMIWIVIGNILRNLMLTHLFYLRRNVTS